MPSKRNSKKSIKQQRSDKAKRLSRGIVGLIPPKSVILSKKEKAERNRSEIDQEYFD